MATILNRIFNRQPAPVAPRREPGGLITTWTSGHARWSEWDSEKAINEGFKASPWVYACIKRRVDAVASVPWRVEKRTADGWEVVSDHPLQKLIERPNPTMSWEEIISMAVTHLDLSGNAFLHEIKVRDGRIRELWPLVPSRVKIVPGTNRLIDAYELSNPRVRIAVDDMVHIKYTNPNDMLFGQSPLMAVGKAVDVDNAAAAWQKVSMQNRGVPDGVFEAKDPNMTDEQFDRARQAVKERYSGIANAREPFVTAGFTFTPMSLTPAEVDFIETRHLSMKEICAVFAVPSEMISGMGDANRASSETVRKTFWLDTILPLLSELQAALTRDLAQEYGDDIRLMYDVSSVPALQQNQDEKMNVAKTLWSMGVPFNVINQKLELGLDDIEGGEVGYIAAGLLPSDFDFSMPSLDDGDIKTLIEKSYGAQNRKP